MTMMMTTTPSLRSAALASLLTSSASVAGQQILLIPRTSPPYSSATGIRSLHEAEPPCRQRRLEPWRQQVRDRCHAEVPNRCPNDQLRLGLGRGEGHGDTYISIRSPSSSMNTLFGDFFTTGITGHGGGGPNVSIFQEALTKDANDDPFERLFKRMLEISLRSFDQKITAMGKSTSPKEEEAGENGEKGDNEEGEEGEEEDSFWEDDWLSSTKDDSVMEYVASAPTPEQAAENVLDIMVASLASHSAASADVNKMEDDQEEEEALPLPSGADLPRLLAQQGNALLDEVAASAQRRRLTEGVAAGDTPRAQVEARLARRLTEYKTDLFYSPADGSVTLYTTNIQPTFMPLSRNAAPPALGMGSRQLDECVYSAFYNQDLSGGCHQAVGKFLLAVDHGSPTSPHHAEFSGESAWPKGKEAMAYVAYAMALLLFGCLCMLCMTSVEEYFGFDDEDDEGFEEKDHGFDYDALPDSDTNGDSRQVSKGVNPLHEPCVFMGIPIQVV